MKTLAISILAIAMTLDLAQGAILDQAQETNSGNTTVSGAGCSFVQTFTSGISGPLDHIDLLAVGPGGTGDPGYPTTVAIVNVENGAPVLPPLAQIDSYIFENGWNSIDFSSEAVFLTAGTQYGILLDNNDTTVHDEPTLHLLIAEGWGVDPYTGGKLWKGHFGNWEDDWCDLISSPVDACFRTYVRLPLCIADAGSDQTFHTIPALVILDGSDSYDTYGRPLTYHWRQIDGPAVTLSDANRVDPTFAPTDFGIYVFELVVNNGFTDSEPDIVGIVIGGNMAPIADAGSSRYAATDPIQLDGTGSYDPDGYGLIAYRWRQISGPNVLITDANTATPTISGFTQTSMIQRCEFELVVSDTDEVLFSRPDTVEVIIVPDFSGTTLVLESIPFDPDKPTIIYFNGGSGGGPLQFGPEWEAKVNILSFTTPHNGGKFAEHGNAIITYLSSKAPDYNQPIQTMGHSSGAKLPAAVGAYLNTTYADSRYNVNHATLFDAYHPSLTEIAKFLNSSVDGEQCWIDNYRAGPYSGLGAEVPGALNVYFPLGDHIMPLFWYQASLDPNHLGWIGEVYNGGIVAGAYLSVAGKGKNVELAPYVGRIKYYFEWEGPNYGPGSLKFYDESLYPGRIPEPVTLLGPADGSLVDSNGAVLTCELSENAVGYQLFFGPAPYRVASYMVISDTPDPPNEVITKFPFEKTYWTIKVRDQYGSTIYADPICIKPITASTRVIKNLTTGATYGYIQAAIDDARTGDEIVLTPGNYSYPKNIDFKGKNITLRSTDPSDPSIVASTVISGGSANPVLTFANGEDTTCTVSGLTITGGSIGIYCDSTSPTVSNCNIYQETGIAIGLRGKSNPTISNCTISGIVAQPGLIKNSTTGQTYDYIQTAIDDANTGDEIVVGPGHYFYPDIDFKGKNLTIRSTDPEDLAVMARTILNGDNQGPVVTFSTGENVSCVLAGCTITNGNKGIYCSGVCPTITNCAIIGNTGVGIESLGTLGRDSPTIINCTIAGNKGVGIYARARKSPTVINCIIVGNKGAGVDADERSTITNCTIVGNELSGISAYRATVTSSIIWGNSSQQIVDDYNNCVVTYSNVQGGWPGDRNIDADPCFADADGPDNVIGTEDDNLRLAPGSPCIDIGNNDVDTDPWIPGIQPLPETDIDGRPRIIDGDCNDTDVIDMGAYEFNYAYMGDFDYNCSVDSGDFSIFAPAWLTEPADAGWDRFCDIGIPADGRIDWRDLCILTNNWLAVF